MFRCPVNDCPHTFKLGATYSSFLSHCNRKHCSWKEALTLQDPDEPRIPGPAVAEDHIDGDLHEDLSTVLESQGGGVDDPDSLPGNVDTLKDAAAQFILTLKEEYRVTQSAVNFTVGAVSQLVESAVQRSMQPLAENPNPFEELQTEHQQSKYYREHFNLVVSSSIIISA